MIAPQQSRAARGWLDWNQEELAKHANVSLSTVRDFEKGRRTPIKNNLDAIQRAIEAAGVQLQFDKEEPVGVRIAVQQPPKEHDPKASPARADDANTQTRARSRRSGVASAVAHIP